MFNRLLNQTKSLRGIRIERGILFGIFFFVVACGAVDEHPGMNSRTEQNSQPKQTSIAVSNIPPADIEAGAYNASLSQAAVYAWNQFIALNWTAVEQTGVFNTRGTPQDGASLVQSGPRVWETLRAKTEIFPGIGDPHGFEAGSAADFGFDEAPLYRYDPAAVGEYPGLEAGQVPACEKQQQNLPAPLIELSESHEVGPERLYSGMAPAITPGDDDNEQRVLFAVKVNRVFYRYVAENGWLDGGNPGSTIPATATGDYINQHGSSPPGGSQDQVSFPDQTLQIKTAWRRLTAQEKSSGRYHVSWARSYQQQHSDKRYLGVAGNPKHPCFVDAQWGLIAMHVKTKTASAPYYIWATFEHLDTLSDLHGNPVEDSAGRLVRNRDLGPEEPDISARNATAAVPSTPDTIQKLSPERADTQPEKRLYYYNLSGTPTTQGRIAVNRRNHDIPPPVIEVNAAAHQALQRFWDSGVSSAGMIPASLLNYKLVGIQWKPANKPVAGQDLQDTQAESDEVLRYHLIYYLANMAMETSYRLQYYSGTVQPRLAAPYQDLSVQDLLTDFDPQGNPVSNMVYAGMKPDGENAGFNMGGCMGCHGQMQLKGYDFNFIFRRGRIDAPETGPSLRIPLVDMVHGKQTHD